jgi:hypothetical protein
MTVAEALKRQQDRPDIHKGFERPVMGSQSGLDDAVYDMVNDLKDNFPDLSIRQLSALVGVSKTFVTKALDQTVEAVEWSADNNEASSAAELAALKYCYPGRQYDDDTENDFEEISTPFLVIMAAPAFADSGIKADQSHTIKRPITLATRPFDVAA